MSVLSNHVRSSMVRQRLNALAAMTLLFALTAAVVVVGATTSAAADGTVTGTVFRDFNGDGVLDDGNAALAGVANDIGVAGVTVSATDALGEQVGQTQTNADGTYSLPVTAAASNYVRIEFSGWDTTLEPSGTSGAGTNGTTVQFVDLGATAGGIDFALAMPGDYAQNNPPLLTTLMHAGLRTSASHANRPTVVGTPWNANYTLANEPNWANGFPDRVTLATVPQTGAVWGSAFNATTNEAYIAATLKRHSDLGPAGLGGIYRIPGVLDGNGNPIDGARAQQWLDVTQLGSGIEVGQTALAAAGSRGLGAPGSQSHDIPGFDLAGKIGIGSIAVDTLRQQLLFINLWDQRLYSLDLTTFEPSDPSAANVTVVDLDLADGERPWAVMIHADTVYVGSTETGEGLAPGTPAATAGLAAHVYAAPSASLAGWQEVATVDLGYTKGHSTIGSGNRAEGVDAPRITRWNTWVDEWTAAVETTVWNGAPGHIYPQPILSDLAVDADGYLVMAFLDRTSVQGGDRNWSAVAGDTRTFETFSSGDLLIAAPSADGSFVLENDGSVGNRTSASNRASQGPGGQEFFNDSLALGATGSHQEIGLGSVALMPGVEAFVAGTYDPLADIRVTGHNWFSLTDGESLAGYQMNTDSGDPAGNGFDASAGSFQKGGGLGAVSVLAQSGPVEIGNRVWFDADQDGLQGADEPHVTGLTVELYDDQDNLVATTTTNGDGEYIFRSDEDGFNPAGEYTVVFVKPTSGNVALGGPNAGSFGSLAWADVDFTTQGGGGPLDSNADPSTGEAPVTIVGPGFNNHTIDAGFAANVAFTVAKQIDPAGGTPAAGQTFTMNLVAQDFRGQPLTLTQSSVTLAGGATSAEFTVPVGSSVQVSETGSYLNTVITDPAGDDHEDFFALTGTGAPFAFTVTNTLAAPGGFTVTKDVTGAYDLESSAIAGATFTVAYEYAGGNGEVELNAANNWTAQVDDLPYGAEVTLSEPTIADAGVAVAFGEPAWSVGDQDDGTAVISIGNGTVQDIVLTNPTTQLVGGFEVTKQVTGDDADRVPANVEFVIEYSLDGGTTWSELDPVAGGDSVQGPTDIPLGTAVLLREVAPVDGTDYTWGTPAFSGTGVVAGTDGTATLTIGATGTAAVTVQNPTSGLNGQFSVTKDVTGAGENLIIGDPTFVVNYTSAAGNGQLTVTNGQTDTSDLLPAGTVVTITEVTPSATWLPDGATWGTPTLTVDGVEQANGSTITIGDGTTVAIVVENPTSVTPDVEIVKGDGAAGAIVNDANSVTTGAAYQAGETRDIVFVVENTGPEPLLNVELVDHTIAGGEIVNLQWQFPDGSVVPANFDSAAGEWTARWEATYAPGALGWQPGDVITGTATLTLADSDTPHQNNVTVTGQGRFSGEPVADEDPYNAFTGSIQVIKYDGERDDPQVREGANWVIPAKPLPNTGQDANTADQAVSYPIETPQAVRWVVTNTGSTWLTDVDLADTTLNGPAIGADWTADLSAFGGPTDYSFVNDGPWAGLFPPGASFFAEGTLELDANEQHGNVVDVEATVVVPASGPSGEPSDDPLTDDEDEPVRATVPDPANPGDELPFVVTDDDPFHARSGDGPSVDIEKGDGDGSTGTIVNDADAMADGELYGAGETRTVVFHVENTGDEDLVDVVLTDTTVAGAVVENLTWTLPDGSTLTATLTGDIWTAEWSETFTGDAAWAPGEIITGTASLMLVDGAVHVNNAEVHANGAASGIPVSDEDPYNAFTGSIQVIKYDGNVADPQVQDGDGNWVIPAKPLVNEAQDANTSAQAVVYPVETPQAVRWVVTNTGDTWLTELNLTDLTVAGPEILGDWTADLSAFGGPADYSFVDDGTWSGLFPPGASFFAEGSLELPANAQHENIVDVAATVVVPETDDDGVPTDEPLLDEDTEEPVRATVPDPENPGQEIDFVVGDDDPFHARSGEGPFVQIIKGDGVTGEIVNDADTMTDGQLYANGETRSIVFHVENIGDEDLVDVVLTDSTLSGAVIQGLSWELPDGTVLDAELSGDTWTAVWEETFSRDAVWEPGEVITGIARLTLDGGVPHVDDARVTAAGAASGIPVEDSNPYNAFTAGIQVIKYDGELADPQVRDGDTWVVPAKPLADAAQDANNRENAVRYEIDEANTVRWVVTNTGSTWLTSVDLADVTDAGPEVSSWTADLSEFGGPADYDFVSSGTWRGLIPPGASFFAEGTLTLPAGTEHANTVTVTANPVVPEVNEDGTPTGGPELDNGVPVTIKDEDGNPVVLTDSDPFHSYTRASSPHTDDLGEIVRDALSSTGVGMAVGVMLLTAIAALGGGFVLVARSRERKHL